MVFLLPVGTHESVSQVSFRFVQRTIFRHFCSQSDRQFLFDFHRLFVLQFSIESLMRFCWSAGYFDSMKLG